MKKFSLIVAVCSNSGIGIKGDLPWRLKSELRHFARMTKRVADLGKPNAIIMGRKTYFGIPEGRRPLPDRLNVVLTRDPASNTYPEGVLVCTSLEDALAKIQDQVENIWIIGGSAVYKEAMESRHCHRIYLTEILAPFECDAFFPEIGKEFRQVGNDADVAEEVQEENGVRFQYKIYEKMDID
uniref:dihydrofolate reductase n=1 Tax=Culex pipiens TaxID=7175 RepID=A0A8D8P0L1_CULPI